ncbi:hypothetical protein P7K49_008716 [Saguinus oedipus]|uniref:Uncharacterized protein n=1 Tax=Saguinus oedipus TaxID=9490 RepID=A0ABQ9VZ85_SAGOE|nr:hypothetical protein P7K49_008716 [Saguinus oedipus]
MAAGNSRCWSKCRDGEDIDAYGQDLQAYLANKYATKSQIKQNNSTLEKPLLLFLFLKDDEPDIQAEIDAHNDIFKSIDGNRQKMVKALGNSEEATMLQHRLDDMNQRWNDLKAKSASISRAWLLLLQIIKKGFIKDIIPLLSLKTHIVILQMD